MSKLVIDTRREQAFCKQKAQGQSQQRQSNGFSCFFLAFGGFPRKPPEQFRKGTEGKHEHGAQKIQYEIPGFERNET